MENKNGISQLIAIIIILSTSIAMTFFVITWTMGILGLGGYGTRPIQVGITSTLHGSGSMFLIYLKNFGGDTLFIDQITIDDKYTAIITASFELSNRENRLTQDENRNKIVILEPGDTNAIIFTVELQKEKIRNIFNSGTQHRIKIHLSIGYEYYTTVQCYYVPHGSWTIRQETSEDGWILQGGHREWGEVETTLHMYILRYGEYQGYNAKITTKAKWTQGSGQLMVIIGYDGQGDGYAIWTNYEEGKVSIVKFEGYGTIQTTEIKKEEINIQRDRWYIFEIEMTGNSETLQANIKITNSENPLETYQLTTNINPLGPNIGVGYWETPKQGEQSIVKFDYFQVEYQNQVKRENFQDVIEMDQKWVEEG